MLGVFHELAKWTEEKTVPDMQNLLNELLHEAVIMNRIIIISDLTYDGIGRVSSQGLPGHDSLFPLNFAQENITLYHYSLYNQVEKVLLPIN